MRHTTNFGFALNARLTFAFVHPPESFTRSKVTRLTIGQINLQRRTGIDGFLYGFREGGLISTDPGFTTPPGQIIETPDDTSSTDFTNLKFKLITKVDYDSLRANPATGNPGTMADAYNGTPVLEFGERINVVAYDFILQDPANPPTMKPTATPQKPPPTSSKIS